jgi:hypothetical protein
LKDPEISTLSTLTNVQNSLFVPDLGSFLNRRPTYTLTRHQSGVTDEKTPGPDGESEQQETEQQEAEEEADREAEEETRIRRSNTLTTIRSTLSESRYAVLPHGASLEGWTVEEKRELNDHVRHMLHSRRAKFKRSMKGFGQYVRRRKLKFCHTSWTLDEMINTV